MGESGEGPALCCHLEAQGPFHPETSRSYRAGLGVHCWGFCTGLAGEARENVEALIGMKESMEKGLDLCVVESLP